MYVPGPSSSGRRAPATAQATATGIRLRGFISNSSSSTASSTAATGVPKVAVMPPAAPAASSVLRSAAVRLKDLGDDGAEGAAGHDDRSLGAERAAGADGDRGRQRLEDGDLGRHAAAADEDGFEGFRDAVAADAVGAVAGHEADDEAADDRHEDGQPEQGAVLKDPAVRGKEFIEGELPGVKQVREEPDQPQQDPGDDRAGRTDDQGQRRDPEKSHPRGEVAFVKQPQSRLGFAVLCHSFIRLRRPAGRAGRAERRIVMRKAARVGETARPQIVLANRGPDGEPKSVP